MNDVISSTFEKFDFDSGEFLLICMDHSGEPAASDACKRSNRKMTFGKSVQRTDGLLQLFVDGKKLTYQRKDRLGIMVGTTSCFVLTNSGKPNSDSMAFRI